MRWRGMSCGLQVSFHDRKAVRKTRVEKRNNDIVNRLNRTKREENPDLAARRDAHDQVQRASPLCPVRTECRMPG